MKPAVLILAASALLSGCAATDQYHRNEASRFTPQSDSAFVYSVHMGGWQSEEGKEHDRLEWLETHLREHGMCSKGYEITDRQQSIYAASPISNVYEVVYRGRCK